MKVRRKQKAPKKSSSAKYKRRRRRELEHRAECQEQEIKRQAERIHREAEFAQRIKEEPALATLLGRASRKEGE